MRKISYALIGSGYWGKNILSTASRLNNIDYICDKEISLVQKYAQQYKLKTIELDDLLNSDIDACYIATPASTHFTIAKDLLNSGKHLFVEKPLCLSSSEAKILSDIATNKGLTLMVGHLLHYHPAIIKLKQIIKEKKLLLPKKVICKRTSFGIVRKDENVLWSFLPHDLSLINFFCNGAINEVNKIGLSFFNDNIDCFHGSFSMGGTKVLLEADWTAPEKKQILEIIFDNYIFRFDDTLDWDSKLSYCKTNFSIDNLSRKSNLAFNTISIDTISPLDNELLHFDYCIKNKIKPITDGSEAIEVLKLLERINE